MKSLMLNRLGCRSLLPFFSGLAAALCLAAVPAQAEPPAGFTALFNGKDLTGWRGGDTFDHRKLLAMPDDQREAQIAKWTETMKAHWRAENGELVNDGQGAYATTEKDYGDFELLVDYKTVPKADTGIYLRGMPAGADLGLHRRRASCRSARTRARAASGTTAPARPARTRWCWPTSRSASGIPSASSWSARG